MKNTGSTAVAGNASFLFNNVKINSSNTEDINPFEEEDQQDLSYYGDGYELPIDPAAFDLEITESVEAGDQGYYGDGYELPIDLGGDEPEQAAIDNFINETSGGESAVSAVQANNYVAEAFDAVNTIDVPDVSTII